MSDCLCIDPNREPHCRFTFEREVRGATLQIAKAKRIDCMQGIMHYNSSTAEAQYLSAAISPASKQHMKPNSREFVDQI